MREVSENEKRALSKEGIDEADEKLAEIQAEIQTLKVKLEANRRRQQDLNDTQLNTESEIEKLEDRLKTIEFIDPEKLEQDKKRRDEIADKKRDIRSQLETVWDNPLPIALLGELREQLLNQLHKEKEKQDWLNRKKAIEPQFPGIKSAIFDDPDEEHLLTPPTYDYYTTRFDKALSRLNPPPKDIEDIKVFVCKQPEANPSIRQLLSKSSKDLQNLEDSCRTFENLEADIHDLDYTIRQQNQSIAAIDEGKKLHRNRTELHVKLTSLQHQLEEAESQHHQMEKKMTELKKQETDWTEKEAKASRRRSLASRANAYREAASLICRRASEQMRKKINRLVSELWLEITERGQEFKKLEFIGEHWHCELVKRNGSKISWDDANTSAGQKQVRLLAFYEALRRLAQIIPPLVADTPLARLDKEVKSAVLNKLYLSETRQQSIVLATNAEIDPESKNSLFAEVRDSFGRAYTLVPKGNPESEDYEVRIKPRYFGKKV